jgi:hypothetical protein
MTMRRAVAGWAVGLLALSLASALGGPSAALASNATLPDLSGLAWMGGERFVAVHDAKNPDELDRPRVSLLRTPTTVDGVPWAPVALGWPAPRGPSSDLESAARVPGTRSVLLNESGEGVSNGRRFRRIFHARLGDAGLQIVQTVRWPVRVQNVEGSAVAIVGGRLFFLFAERAEGQPSTMLRWARMRLNPLTFGRFRGTTYRSPAPKGPDARPVSAIDVDHRNRIFVASAFDSGDDDGPFASAVWHAGRIATGKGATARVRLLKRPRRIARLDGLKVESLAARRTAAGRTELFAGTDDENYGGALRLLPQL